MTNLSGTSTVGGINVTVTSAGIVSSNSCSGVSQPYLEGQDITTSTFGVGSYTWSFSVPVGGIQIHMESIDIGDDVSIMINGVPYFVTSANMAVPTPGTSCLVSSGNAVAFGGEVVNSGDGGSNGATITITPGYGINTVTVQSLGGGSGVLNDFTFLQNTAPAFTNGSIQLFSICEASPAYDVSSMLSIADTDPGQTITWNVATAPQHGTTTGFPTAVTSTGGTVTPSGLFYTPVTGFNGFDTLVVSANDGVTTTLDTLVITVKPLPLLTSSHTIQAVCTGTLVDYTPTSQVAGTTFAWNRPFIGGISNPADTGTGNPMEVLNNVTYYNINVTYIYTLAAQGCTDTTHVTIDVMPAPSLSSNNRDTVCNGQAINYVPTSGSPNAMITWTRASVTGISPATGTGGGTITEALTNNTTAPIDVVYEFSIIAGGCSSVRTLTVTVNPPLAGVPITTMPPSTLCSGADYQNFGAGITPAPGITYSWSVTNATLAGTGSTGQYALVNFDQAGTAVVTLNTSIPGSSCNSTDNYTVTVSESENPSAAIIYYNYELIYMDNTASTYQWGYDDVSTLDSTAIAEANFQSLPINSLDMVHKYYWVITMKNGCLQKTYYNAPVAVTNVVNSSSVTVYPNPANSMVNIALTTQPGYTTDVTVTNMLGQTMKTLSGNGHNMQLNIADMPAGVYLVNCSQNGVRVATGRFIKN